MIKTQIGTIDDDPVYYCQLESIQEFEQEKPLNGMYFFWLHKGRKIYNPYEIITIVQKGVLSNNFGPSRLLDKQILEKHHANVRSKHVEAMVSQLNRLKEDHLHNKDDLEYIDNIINQYKNNEMPFPDSDGIFRPTQDEAEKIFGKENLNLVYSKEDKKRIFKD